MAKLNNFIENRASNTYRVHEFVKEYGVFISLVLLVKIATSLFSVFAGYYFVKVMFIELLNNYAWAMIFSMLTLILIELLTNISLSKFYKTSLRGKIKSAIAFILLSFVFFGLSFYLSTNGLALRQAKRTDNSKMITEKYNLQLSELEHQAESEKNQAKEAIELIKANPSGWRNGKRDVLLSEQLAAINSYYSQIERITQRFRQDKENLKDARLKELHLNTELIAREEKKYYRIVVGVMVIQLFVNGLIMFFYSRIYNEKHKDQLAKETVQEFASDISDTTDKLIKHNISSAYMNYLSALSFQLKENDVKKSIEQDKSKVPQIGFKNMFEISRYNATMGTNEKQINSNDITNQFKSNDKDAKLCKHCGKSFSPYNIRQVFCSANCRMTWHKENKGFDIQKYLNTRK
jgi:hypothetical protein